jgi:integrase
LRCFRLTKRDRPVIDPFSIQEAETLIAAIHRDWGETQGNFDEFRFLTGLRPSEQIALLVSDCDVAQGKLSVTKARVIARDKDRTKTGEDRLIELCPRALEVLKRQLALAIHRCSASRGKIRECNGGREGFESHPIQLILQEVCDYQNFDTNRYTIWFRAEIPRMAPSKRTRPEPEDPTPLSRPSGKPLLPQGSA